MKTIDRTELEQWTREERTFALLAVLPDAQPAEGLPPAGSQADFLDQMARLGAHKEQPVVLYEAPSASVSFSAAATLLKQAGFGSVYHFAGPRSALHAAGHGAPPAS